VGSLAPAGGNGSSVSRNVTISGHRTSIRLQREMWDALEEICRRERITLHQLCTRIAEIKSGRSLTSEVRVFAVGYFRAAADDEGHRRAGHGMLDSDGGERHGAAAAGGRAR
jgi:predicted DNA-binding ribbon-helix-helix protein